MKNFPEDQVRRVARVMGEEFKTKLEQEHGTPDELERIFREELGAVLPQYFSPPPAPAAPPPAAPPATPPAPRPATP